MFQKKFLAAAVIMIIVIAGVSFFFDVKGESLSHSGIFVMDTYCDITLDGISTDSVSALLFDLEKQLDSHYEKSDISKFNSGFAIGENTAAGDVILQSLDLQEKYKGGVDVTAGGLVKLWDITGDSPHVPDSAEIKRELSLIGRENIHRGNGNLTIHGGAKADLGAVAKGYALDRVKDLLDETNAEYGTVSMTSSILYYGEKPDGEMFKTAVRGAENDEILGIAETGSCFVSSSGSYERYFTDENGKKYSHILDTHTGCPTETDLASVTVFCQSGIMSDYLSTLIFMGGTDNIEKYLRADDYMIAAADNKGNLYVSPNLKFMKTKTGGKEK